MCGRVRQVIDLTELKILWWHGFVPPNVRPRWNGAPRQDFLMIRPHHDTAADGAEAVSMSWGFVPSWERDLKGGIRPINAKSENVASGMWRDAFRRCRALLPVSGFYEWQTTGGQKLPYSIDRADGAPLYLAALCSPWTVPATGEALDTFAVMTTTPNAVMAPIHSRMPVIIAEADVEGWLYGPPDAATALLVPCPPGDLVAYRVSERVGNVRNDDPGVAAPA